AEVGTAAAGLHQQFVVLERVQVQDDVQPVAHAEGLLEDERAGVTGEGRVEVLDGRVHGRAGLPAVPVADAGGALNDDAGVRQVEQHVGGYRSLALRKRNN